MKTKKRILSIILAAVLILTAALPAAAASDPLTYQKGSRLESDGTVSSFYKVASCVKTASGEITVPDTYQGLEVREIGDGAFADCGGITAVNIPSSVDKIGANAFENCLGLEKVSYQGSAFESSSRVIGVAAFRNCIALKTVLLPGGLTEIKDEAFKKCAALTGVSLPDTLKKIGKGAFSLCSGFTSVTIPASVTDIAETAFMNCSGIEKFSVASGNTAYKAVGGVLYTADGKTLVQYPNGSSETTYAVPAGTTTVGNFAFGANTKLTAVSLPSSLTAIGPYGFYMCSKLGSVNLPSGLKTIGSLAFADCPMLTEVTLPTGLTSYEGAFDNSGLVNVVISDGVSVIDAKAFQNCSSLTGVSIPSTVTEIRFGAFSGCSALHALEIPESVKTLGNGIFGGCAQLVLTVTEGSAAHTYAKNNNIDYIVKGGGSVKELTSVTIRTLPQKTSYIKGEKISDYGLTLTAHYSDGTTGIITGGFTISPATALTLGTQKVTVSYSGKTASFNITVTESADKPVKSIAIATLPAKTSYHYKETLNTAGLTLTVFDENGSRTVSSGYTITSPTYFDSTGSKTITVEYEGCTASFNVSVSYSFFQFIIMYICLGFLWGY